MDSNPSFAVQSKHNMFLIHDIFPPAPVNITALILPLHVQKLESALKTLNTLINFQLEL